MTPPLITVGSSDAPSRTAATIDVVVVLPCVPATVRQYFNLMSSASISERLMTGILNFRAASTSGFSSVLMAEEITSKATSAILDASWPLKILMPIFWSRWTLAFSLTSDP